jgi:MFS family permease
VLGGRQFWLIACALLLVSTVTQGLVVHTVPLLTDKGYSPETAATLMVAVGLSTMAGRLLSGYLVDRIFAPFIAAFFFLLPCLGIYLLDSTVLPVAGIISLGLAFGTEIDMIGYLTSRYFGMKRFGQLYGYLFASFVIGSAIGPLMMGLAFERLHSYEPALWTIGAFMLIASAAILSLSVPIAIPLKKRIRPVLVELWSLLPPNAHKGVSHVPDNHSTSVCCCSLPCLQCVRSMRGATWRHGQ